METLSPKRNFPRIVWERIMMWSKRLIIVNHTSLEATRNTNLICTFYDHKVAKNPDIDLLEKCLQMTNMDSEMRCRIFTYLYWKYTKNFNSHKVRFHLRKIVLYGSNEMWIDLVVATGRLPPNCKKEDRYVPSRRVIETCSSFPKGYHSQIGNEEYYSLEDFKFFLEMDLFVFENTMNIGECTEVLINATTKNMKVRKNLGIRICISLHTLMMTCNKCLSIGKTEASDCLVRIAGTYYNNENSSMVSKEQFGVLIQKRILLFDTCTDEELIKSLNFTTRNDIENVCDGLFANINQYMVDYPEDKEWGVSKVKSSDMIKRFLNFMVSAIQDVDVLKYMFDKYIRMSNSLNIKYIMSSVSKSF